MPVMVHITLILSYNVSASTDTEEPTFDDTLIQALGPDSRCLFVGTLLG